MDQDIRVDWGEASENFDGVSSFVAKRDLTIANEAQTRFDVIDRMLREVLGWKHGQIRLEEHLRLEDGNSQYIDYLLRSGDTSIVVEAKKAGAAFPSPTKKAQLKLNGAVLGSGEIGAAISQAVSYAHTKDAQVVVVTNGLCWCSLSVRSIETGGYGVLFFPFEKEGDAEKLFRSLSLVGVEHGSLDLIAERPPHVENRVLSILRDADGRIDRNNIADFITPALDNALYADALLTNLESLEKCFVTTEARVRFDSLLGMHLADPKPQSVTPARRIKTGQSQGPLEQVVESGRPTHAPPVTLIIGPVGAGKSTYLKHFELIAGKKALAQRGAHWIYVDFEAMGPGGNPRDFLYKRLRDYILAEHPVARTDYNAAIEPAYREEIASLARGPLAPLTKNKTEFQSQVVAHIRKDFDAVEPFVDKVISYLARSGLCVVVIDNVDLAEDDDLEKTVFAEGLAFSKRAYCHVIVSVRDRTFVRHRTDSAFDAYELRKLWLDPPPFRAVLSSRLTYCRKILEGQKARIRMANGATLMVEDLGEFFDVVQSSILKSDAGDFISSVADLNIRKGLSLVTNFLTSGHIQADRALQSLIHGGMGTFMFPFHEIFKGTMLGQWRYYRENRAECINLFDSHLGGSKLRLVRLTLLNLLIQRAQHEQTVEVPFSDCMSLLSDIGFSETQLIRCLGELQAHGLIRSVAASPIDPDSTLVVTRSGGYYAKVLTRKFVYCEECLYDTAIEKESIWEVLANLSEEIEESGSNLVRRMELRAERIKVFLDYLCELEQEVLMLAPNAASLAACPEIRGAVRADVALALRGAKKNYGRDRGGRKWTT